MNVICTPASELRPGNTFDLFQAFCTVITARPNYGGAMTVRFVTDKDNMMNPKYVSTIAVPKNFEFNIHSS